MAKTTTRREVIGQLDRSVAEENGRQDLIAQADEATKNGSGGSGRKKKDVTIRVMDMHHGTIRVWLVGDTPLVFNILSMRAKMELLYPGGGRPRNSLKHDPVQEFRDSFYHFKDPNAPTLFGLPATAVKKAIASVATSMDGPAKTQIGRLTFVPGNYLPVYGLPYLFMTPIKTADQARTPDIRTRAIIPFWAIPVDVRFMMPHLNPTSVSKLLANAGVIIALGDGRVEKGTLNNGQFHVLGKDKTAEIKNILKYGRKQQEKAELEANCYDEDTSDLLSWFLEETRNRGESRLITHPGEPSRPRQPLTPPSEVTSAQAEPAT